ncbi:hypothetical protein LSAT2_004570 [Lamellibrachia satsuma]|nr:hypothetical protein LSAT2_004570 [Lamellibrachia satsuma]
MPLECHPNVVWFWQSLRIRVLSLVSWDQQDPCEKYHLALLVHPLWEVNLPMVLISSFTRWIPYLMPDQSDERVMSTFNRRAALKRKAISRNRCYLKHSKSTEHHVSHCRYPASTLASRRICHYEVRGFQQTRRPSKIQHPALVAILAIRTR